MRSLTVRCIALLALVLTPVIASAQTSAISGTVKDASGGVLPGVTVEVSSPALIEKTRSTVTSGSGQYTILALRPGIYTVKFELPGFAVVVREGVELTSDFTATINTDLKVGTLEETLTVTGESPIVDTSNITQRVVMTQEVRDALPTGRNIQAVGIMIPGTTLAQGGGGALSRDVGGSGNLQQSPLQYRGSGDTVQTIEGLRLNNLCAQGAYSRRLLERRELRRVQLCDGRRFGRSGPGRHARQHGAARRRQLVPRLDDHELRGRGLPIGQLRLARIRQWRPPALHALESERQQDVQPEQHADQRRRDQEDLGRQSRRSAARSCRNKIWFNYTFRHWGSTKTKADAYFDKNPSQFVYDPDFTQPGIDDGHIVSNAGRISWQVSGKDKISVYHDEQNKYRNHWGIAATIPPEAAGVQVTPTSRVNVSKWTRTHTNKLLLEGGFGYYNQEYTELYQPSVTGHEDKVWSDEAIINARVYNVLDQSNNRQANAWPNPADHFSILRTFMGAASYVAGSHSFRGGLNWTTGDWKLLTRWTGDMQPITYNAGRPVSVTLRLPSDRNNGVDRDLGLFLQDKWSLGRVTLNLGIRYDNFVGESRESSVLPSRLSGGATFGECSDGTVDPGDLCTGQVQNWKDISPRVGFAMDVFGDGRTAVKASYARYVAGQAIAFANQVNPIGALTASDIRPWTDVDGNGLPLDSAGNIQFNELDQLGVDADLRPFDGPDDAVLAGPAPRLGQARLQRRDHIRDAAPDRGSRIGERRLLSPHVRQCDFYRRPALRREQLRLVLHHDAPRSGPAGRRRLPGVRRAGFEASGVRAEPSREQPDPLLGRLRRLRPTCIRDSTSTSMRGSATARSSRRASAPRRARSTTAICSRPASTPSAGWALVPGKVHRSHRAPRPTRTARRAATANTAIAPT